MAVAPSAELCLLVMAESEIASGLALAARIAHRNDYHTRVFVVSDKPAALLEHLKSQMQAAPSIDPERFELVPVATEFSALLERINDAKDLRLLLLPGLDQLNDDRRQLLRKVHAAVACFEPHAGLFEAPQSLHCESDDHCGAAKWLCDQLIPKAELQPTTLDDLRNAAKSPPIDGGNAPTDRAADQLPALHAAGDWVFLSATAATVDSASRRCKSVIQAAVGPVILVRSADSLLTWWIRRYPPLLAAKYAPQMSRQDRMKLAEDLSTYSRLDFDFVALICAAAFLASFGLVQGSAAVIIGAMLVAPLMTPILGAGLSLAQGNRPLFMNALRTIALGFLAALLTGTFFGLLIRWIPNSILEHSDDGIVMTGEMWSRTSPTIIDFLVGLVGGSAAAYARTRNHLSAALAGAAIAAALVPPIATAGLQISFMFQAVAPLESGRAGNLIYGPMLLFLANMLTIMIGSSFVLWACGVRGDHPHSIKERWTTRMTLLLMLLTVMVAVWITQHS